MKKKILIFATVLLICCLSFVLVACGDDDKESPNQEQQNNQPEITLVAISVDGPAQADIDEFDLSDYKIVATFSDGSTKTITLTSDFISADDLALFENEGLYSVKVSYQNKICTWNITISSNKEEDLCKDGHKDISTKEEQRIDATCTTAGSYYEVTYCRTCGEEISREKKTIEKLNHDLVHHDAKDATCTEIGWYEYDTCSRCDYTTYEEIPAGHDIIHHNGKDATCTEVGWYAYDTCSRCDYTTYEEIPASHQYLIHEAKNPTCTEVGWNAYETCAFCDYTTYEEIPALDHDLVHHDGPEVICSEYDTCTRCDYTTYEGHDFVNEICTKCGVWEYASDLIFELNADNISYTITGITNKNITKLIIPTSINDLPVTGIGYEAFFGCNGLTNLTIPESVISIGGRAFNNCSGLTSLSIGSSVTSIGDEAFQFCSRLVEVWNKSSLDFTIGTTDNGYVGYYAFVINTEDSPSKITIDDNGFVIYDGTILVGYLGNSTDITIPDAIQIINNNAFYNCDDILNVVIGNNVISLGEYAFWECSCLESVILSDNITSIGDCVFAYCSALKNITIPESVTRIGNNVFFDCQNLTSIVIPNSVEYIGDYVFFACGKLTSVTIGDSVTHIGFKAFGKCSSLSEINYNGTMSSWKSIQLYDDIFDGVSVTNIHCIDGDVDI